jgi:hypothetical protein
MTLPLRPIVTRHVQALDYLSSGAHFGKIGLRIAA